MAVIIYALSGGDETADIGGGEYPGVVTYMGARLSNAVCAETGAVAQNAAEEVSLHVDALSIQLKGGVGLVELAVCGDNSAADTGGSAQNAVTGEGEGSYLGAAEHNGVFDFAAVTNAAAVGKDGVWANDGAGEYFTVFAYVHRADNGDVVINNGAFTDIIVAVEGWLFALADAVVFLDIRIHQQGLEIALCFFEQFVGLCYIVKKFRERKSIQLLKVVIYFCRHASSSRSKFEISVKTLVSLLNK